VYLAGGWHDAVQQEKIDIDEFEEIVSALPYWRPCAVFRK
jgi:hypothetical protein